MLFYFFMLFYSDYVVLLFMLFHLEIACKGTAFFAYMQIKIEFFFNFIEIFSFRLSDNIPTPSKQHKVIKR